MVKPKMVDIMKKGKAEMRYNAGIAMEYFEKKQEELSEVSFIEDWEVI